MVAQVLEEPLSVLQDIPGILEEGWGVPGGGLGVIDEIPGVLKENFRMFQQHRLSFSSPCFTFKFEFLSVSIIGVFSFRVSRFINISSVSEDAVSMVTTQCE